MENLYSIELETFTLETITLIFDDKAEALLRFYAYSEQVWEGVFLGVVLYHKDVPIRMCAATDNIKHFKSDE